MKIIDLRHIVEPDCDIVKFVGAKDKKEYALPVKITLKATLYSQEFVPELHKRKDEMDNVEFNLEAGYVYILSWMKAHYKEITIEWVKENIVDENILSAMVSCVTKLFFEPSKIPETVKPKRPRKKRLS